MIPAPWAACGSRGCNFAPFSLKGSSVKNLQKSVAAALVLATSMVATSANAAVAAGITTAITDAFADANTVAASVTIGAAVLWAALLIKRKFFG